MNEEKPNGAAPAPRLENAMAFMTPAVIVNNFQLCIAPSYARIACAETGPDGTFHTRAVMACDYRTLEALHELIGKFLLHRDEMMKGAAASENGAAETTPAVVPAAENDA